MDAEIFSTNAWNFYWNWKRKEKYYTLFKKRNFLEVIRCKAIRYMIDGFYIYDEPFAHFFICVRKSLLIYEDNFPNF